MKLPSRKNIRLTDYDYSQNGAYFITICVKKKHELLGKIVGDGVLDVPPTTLSDTGIIVRDQLQLMSDFYNDISIEKHVVMPNHVHMIILLGNGWYRGTSGTPSPTNAVIPRFISTFKRFTHKQAGFSFWQRGYHDHIIRNETEYQKVWQYIDENPIKWTKDKYYCDND